MFILGKRGGGCKAYRVYVYTQDMQRYAWPDSTDKAIRVRTVLCSSTHRYRYLLVCTLFHISVCIMFIWTTSIYKAWTYLKWASATRFLTVWFFHLTANSKIFLCLLEGRLEDVCLLAWITTCGMLFCLLGYKACYRPSSFILESNIQTLKKHSRLYQNILNFWVQITSQNRIKYQSPS